MDKKSYIKIPTWNPNTQWGYTVFSTKEEFREFVKGLFKEPGLYNFDETAWLFNEHARNFLKNKMYCEAPELSRDYIEYWDTEKEKCRKGVIFENGKGDMWYLPRGYYHWINFLQIYNKARKGFHFADVRDVQYHIALYEVLATLHDKDCAELKKRQIAWSYMHIAKMYNYYIFENGFVGKLMASDKKYINATHGDWKFLEEYHNFTNMHTAWACSNMPHKEFSWQQKVETKTPDGRKVQVGTKATISGITLDKDPISGVGGASDFVLYDEGGIAPTAHITHGYMKPAMKEGAIKTGTFIIGGSVGDLEQCEPLRDMIYNPDAHDIYPVHSNLLDANGTEGWSGLFIPEQWGYAGETEESNCIDQYGNSLVQKALDYLDKLYEDIRKKKKPEEYQLTVSQGPRNIAEAFAIRKVSIFPVKHTTRQVRRIEDNEYFLKNVEIERNTEGKIVTKATDRQPMPYPITGREEDKRGCVVIHEYPVLNDESNVDWGLYYASVDPVEKGTTLTSDSLAAIYIYKNPVEVTKVQHVRQRSDGVLEEQDDAEVTNFVEGDKLVCEWIGRYDDVNETNEQLSLIVEYYNAWTVCENQKTSFINYMIAKRRQKYLVHRKDMMFDKELQVEQNVHDVYGWSKSQKLWAKMIEYAIDFLSEEDPVYNKDGSTRKIIYGVERIPFIWLLKEMQNYEDKKGKNFDRIIAYTALIAFAKIQQANIGIRKKIQRMDNKLPEPQELRNLKVQRNMFSQVGRNRTYQGKTYERKAFKNLR